MPLRFLANNEDQRICPSKCRAIAPGFLDNDLFRLQTLQYAMKMTRTWDSTMSMVPKGGDTIWVGIDWSPEEICSPSSRKQRNNDTQANEDQTGNEVSQTKRVNYGRIVSFGKDVAEAPSFEIEMIDFRVRQCVSLDIQSTLD